MTDWANEIAKQLVDRWLWKQGDTFEADIAVALRKARADGVEECAVWVAHIGQPALADALRALKVKYEP